MPQNDQFYPNSFSSKWICTDSLLFSKIQLIKTILLSSSFCANGQWLSQRRQSLKQWACATAVPCPFLSLNCTNYRSIFGFIQRFSSRCFCCSFFGFQKGERSADWRKDNSARTHAVPLTKALRRDGRLSGYNFPFSSLLKCIPFLSFFLAGGGQSLDSSQSDRMWII